MVERVYGALVHWNADRGFGFVRCPGRDSDLFVGEGAFRSVGIEPRVGLRLVFAIGYDRDGRPRAVDLVEDADEDAA